MEQDNQPGGWRALLRWAMTPPQSVLVYFIVLVLVLGASYTAGTMKPRKPPAEMAPPAAALPRN